MRIKGYLEKLTLAVNNSASQRVESERQFFRTSAHYMNSASLKSGIAVARLARICARQLPNQVARGF